jgi:hypothetical protein
MHFHKWKLEKEYWVKIIGYTYNYRELKQLFRCEECSKLKERPTFIIRTWDKN